MVKFEKKKKKIFICQIDLTHQINLSKTNCESTNEENEKSLDISWRPPTNLVTDEEWIQTTIEVKSKLLLSNYKRNFFFLF